MASSESTLAARLGDAEVLAELRTRWVRERRLRIEDALAPGLADAFHASAMAEPFTFFERHEGEVQAVFWRQVRAWQSDRRPESAFPIDAAHRLHTVDIPALASAITGQALRSVPEDGLALDLYVRGSYLDTHTDQGPDRLVAYVVGLTRDCWPVSGGGHLEFLELDGETVTDRIAPGFGTIDLFTIYPLVRPHRVPLLEVDVTRLSMNGWLTGELRGPLEDTP